MGQLTNTSRADDVPDPDGSIKEVTRIKTRHYRNVYLNHPEPMFLHDHHESSVLTNELVEESDQFLFLWTSCFTNFKGTLVWLWWNHLLYGFQSLWTSHLGLSYRFLVSSVRVAPHHLYLLPSYFFLRVLTKRYMLSVSFSLSLACVLIIDLTWHLSSLVLRPFLFCWK